MACRAACRSLPPTSRIARPSPALRCSKLWALDSRRRQWPRLERAVAELPWNNSCKCFMQAKPVSVNMNRRKLLPLVKKSALERVPIKWNPLIDRDAAQNQRGGDVKTGTAEQVFRVMLKRSGLRELILKTT